MMGVDYTVAKIMMVLCLVAVVPAGFYESITAACMCLIASGIFSLSAAVLQAATSKG